MTNFVNHIANKIFNFCSQFSAYFAPTGGSIRSMKLNQRRNWNFHSIGYVLDLCTPNYVKLWRYHNTRGNQATVRDDVHRKFGWKFSRVREQTDRQDMFMTILHTPPGGEAFANNEMVYPGTMHLASGHQDSYASYFSFIGKSALLSHSYKTVSPLATVGCQKTHPQNCHSTMTTPI